MPSTALSTIDRSLASRSRRARSARVRSAASPWRARFASPSSEVRFADLLLQLLAAPAEDRLGLLLLGDVEGDPLEEQRIPLGVADHLGLAPDPDHPAVPGEEAILRAERDAGEDRLGELRLPAVAVVGVELLVPEDRVLQPLLLREPEDRLDLGADVELLDALGPSRPGR